eukprot:11800475-Karenia_brevis.AAC.1
MMITGEAIPSRRVSIHDPVLEHLQQEIEGLKPFSQSKESESHKLTSLVGGLDSCGSRAASETWIDSKCEEL